MRVGNIALMMLAVIVTLLLTGVAFCVGLGRVLSKGLWGLRLGLGVASGLTLMAVLRLVQAASHPQSLRVQGEVAWAVVVLVPALILWCALLLGYEAWIHRQERPAETPEGTGLNPSPFGSAVAIIRE